MINLLVLLLALAGLAVSGYIFYKKRKHEQLICFIGEDCNKVINSKFNTILGIPNEVLGLLYYGAVAVATLMVIMGVTTLLSISLPLVLTLTGGLAAAFAIILIFIQGAVIKEWCEYCLLSAGLSTAIFIIELL